MADWSDLTFYAQQQDYIAALNTFLSRAQNNATEVENARESEADLLANIQLRLKQADVDSRISALAPTYSGGSVQNLSFNGKRITNLSDPIDPQDSATVAWVQAQITGGGNPGDIPITSLNVGTSTSRQRIQVNDAGTAVIGQDTDTQDAASRLYAFKNFF